MMTAGKEPRASQSSRTDIRFQGYLAELTPPPTDVPKPAEFIGPITCTGKDTEQGDDGKAFSTAGRTLQGTVAMGKPFDVVVNMCPISLLKMDRHLYQVDFTPEQELRRRRRYLLLDALKDCGQDLAYDGDHLLYAVRLINNKTQLEVMVQASLPGGSTETVLVKLQWTSYQKAELNKESVMFFCTRFKAAMETQKDRICIDRDYYDWNAAEEVPQYHCKLAPGLSQTIYATQCGPLLCADIMFKHIRTDTVWDNIRQMQRSGQGSEAAIRAAIQMEFRRKSVLPIYSDPKRCVIVDEVRFDLTPKSKFNYKGNLVTYADYYRSRYGITNRDLDDPQPLLENRSRTKRNKDGEFQKSYFIPSLCNLTGQTEEMKNDRYRSRELMKRTAVPPGERVTKIYTALTTMLRSDPFKQTFEPWGISVTPKLLRFSGRRLATPVVRNGSGPVQVNQDSESWVIRGKFNNFLKADCFTKWAVLTYQRTEELRQLIENLTWLATNDMGIQMSQPKVFDTKGDKRPNAYKQVLDTQIKPGSQDGPLFVLVNIPVVDEEPYRTVKQLLAHCGVPSQFVVNRNLQTNAVTKATKIVLQMNCKGGGAPWTANLDMKKPTMIVGLDVHHGVEIEHQGGSVAAYVATLNLWCSRMYSRTFIVKPRQQELAKMSPEAAGLKELTIDAIEAFKKESQRSPQHIVVYRDGGSEGELSTIKRYEVQQFLDAIKEAKLECNLTFFVVLKKIRTRFFMLNPSNDSEVSNPLPGTILDRHVTNSTEPEFLLCCQHVNQGSATPTKYQLVYDDSDIDPDTLSKYTYYLSHLYYNWSGTIRVPAPVKYASTLAKFVGQFLRGKEPAAALWDKLHYL